MFVSRSPITLVIHLLLQSLQYSHNMLTSTLLSALATAATASAAKTYLAYAWNETAPEIHGKAVQARNGYFYLGGQAFPVCADDDFDCAAQNKTLITGPLPSKYSTNYDGFFMDITDSEVQEIVTSPNTGGLLYTMPKTELAILDYKTRETINTPFSIDLDDYSNQTVLRFNGNDFVSCPSLQLDWGNQPYTVKAASYGDIVYTEDGKGLVCTPFKMRLVETDLPAPVYYKNPCTSAQGSVSGQEGQILCPDSMIDECWDGCTDAEKADWTVKVVSGEQCQCKFNPEKATGYGA